MLYLVGTPIGHLGDLSERARTVLAAADVIACEDTRHSGQLLSDLEARGRRLSFHRHNIRARLPQLLELLGEPLSVAVISDAGLRPFMEHSVGLLLVASTRGASRSDLLERVKQAQDAVALDLRARAVSAAAERAANDG